jgi:hypothetical protein
VPDSFVLILARLDQGRDSNHGIGADVAQGQRGELADMHIGILEGRDHGWHRLAGLRSELAQGSDGV